MLNADSENDDDQNKSKFLEDQENGYDPKDLVEILDGWELFRKKKSNTNTMVKRYCYSLD